MQVMIKDGKLAFPELFQAKAFNGEGIPSYSATVIMSKDNPSVKDVEAAIEQVGRDKWKDKWDDIKKELIAKDRLALHDGDTKASTAGFSGNMFVSARNRSPVKVVDRDASDLTALDGRPYAGAIINMSIDIWAQDNGFGRRINASLRGVQFVKDGEPFSGSTVASNDEFGALDDDLAAVGLM